MLNILYLPSRTVYAIQNLCICLPAFYDNPRLNFKDSKLVNIRVTELIWQDYVENLFTIDRWTEEAQHVKTISVSFELDSEDNFLVDMEETVEIMNKGLRVQCLLQEVRTDKMFPWLWVAPKGSVLKWKEHFSTAAMVEDL